MATEMPVTAGKATAQELAATATASAVVREAAASALADILDRGSQEEFAAAAAATKLEKTRKILQ